MKNFVNFYYFVLWLCFFSLQGCNEDISFIKGKLPLPDSAIVRLVSISDNNFFRSVKIENNIFNLSTKGLPAGIYNLQVSWPNKNIKEESRMGINGQRLKIKDFHLLFTSIPVYLEPNKQYTIYTKIIDTIKIEKATIRDTNILPLGIVTNSNETKNLLFLDSMRNVIQKDFFKKQDSLQRLSDLFLERNEMENYKEVANKVSGLLQSFFKVQIIRIHKKFISSHLSSPITPYLITIAPDLIQNKNYYNKVVEKLDPELGENRYTIEARKRLTAIKELKKGDLFPKISGENISGNPVRFNYGSKLTLVEFWASWCAPCRAVNPTWVKLYKSYRQKGLEIIGISFDTSRTSWKKAIDNDELPWQQASDLLPLHESENSIKYNITTIPANYLLDKHQKIIAVNIIPRELEKYLLSN